MKREIVIDKENDPNHFWSSEPEIGELLASLIKLHSCTKVLEIGVYTGYTSLAMIEAMPSKGVYIGVDIEDLRHVSAKEKMTKPHKFFAMDSHKFLSETKELFDLIFIDGNHEYDHVLTEFKLCERVIKKGGLICFHDSIGIADIKKVIDYIKTFPYFEVITLNSSDNRGVSIVKCNY